MNDSAYSIKQLQQEKPGITAAIDTAAAASMEQQYRECESNNARGNPPAAETYSESNTQQWLQVNMTSYLFIVQNVLEHSRSSSTWPSANQRRARAICVRMPHYKRR